MSKENESVVQTDESVDLKPKQAWVFDEFQDEDFGDMFKHHNVPEGLQEEILRLRNILDGNSVVGVKEVIMNGPRDKEQLFSAVNRRIGDIEDRLLPQYPMLPEAETLKLKESQQYYICIRGCLEAQGRELAMNVVAIMNRRKSEVGQKVYDKYHEIIKKNFDEGGWLMTDMEDGKASEIIRRYPAIVNSYLEVFEETASREEILEFIKARPYFAREIIPLFQDLDKTTKTKLLKTYYGLRNFLPLASRKPGTPIDADLSDKRTARVLDSADPEAILEELNNNKELLEKLLSLIPVDSDRLVVGKTLEGHASVILEKSFDGILIRLDHSAEPVLTSEGAPDTKIEFKPFHLMIHSDGLVESDMMFDQDIRFDHGYLLREKGPVNEQDLMGAIFGVVEGKSVDIGEACGFTNFVLNTK